MSNIRDYPRPRGFVEMSPAEFSRKYDEFIQGAYVVMGDIEDPITNEARRVMKLGIEVLEQYRHCFDELAFYRRKYTPIPPIDLEMSGLMNCHVGKCECGHLLRQDRDKCCPKCNQFILWPGEPNR